MATGGVILSVFFGLTVIAAILVYANVNGSGHTAFNPYSALMVFGPVTIVVGVVVGVIGSGLLVYLDRSNTLLQYEIWIQRGMSGE